ncbi:COG1470 family protein [Chengkuizengella axinellae]|uniref:DUF4352 domain-containing protein n=1 Tax=Chengkuizengella axinellae TaxID=3064388 RepID=A0ABT9IYF7_9BACL|nr:hypothetical protein [Chengkuizengella sp. 2205SS18-9]MDP5274390.1 hypothetical protein [Chengkuizengella sp. 2205SS18-9]
MLKKALIFILLVLVSVSIISIVSSYTKAEVDNQASFTITNSENSLITVPNLIEKTINPDEDKEFKIKVTNHTDQTINFNDIDPVKTGNIEISLKDKSIQSGKTKKLEFSIDVTGEVADGEEFNIEFPIEATWSNGEAKFITTIDLKIEKPEKEENDENQGDEQGNENDDNQNDVEQGNDNYNEQGDEQGNDNDNQLDDEQGNDNDNDKKDDDQDNDDDKDKKDDDKDNDNDNDKKDDDQDNNDEKDKKDDDKENDNDNDKKDDDQDNNDE